MRVSATHIVVAQKGIQAITGIITAFLITQFLSPLEQGYYYTLGSLLSGYSLIDLGLSSLITQKSAQLSKGLPLNPNHWSKRARKSEGRHFLGLIRWSQRAYQSLAIGSLILLPIGYFFFSRTHNDAGIVWQQPWALIVLSVALSLPAQGFLSLLEGTGAVVETYSLRIIHYLIGAALGWTLIICHQGLYALAMPLLMVSVVTSIRYVTKYRSALQISKLKVYSTDWKKDLWPHQKEIATLWISNYGILNLPVLMSFSVGTIEDSGKLGLSIVIANVIGAIALAPVTSKLPRLIHQIERGERGAATQSFYQALLRSGIFYVLASMLFALGLHVFNGAAFQDRLLEPPLFLVLMFAFAAFHGFNAIIAFLRVKSDLRMGYWSLLTVFVLLVGSVLLSDRGLEGMVWLLAGSLWVLMIILWLSSSLQNSQSPPAQPNH